MLKAMEACPPRGALFSRTPTRYRPPLRSCPALPLVPCSKRTAALRPIAGWALHARTPGRKASDRCSKMRTDAGEDIQACEVRQARNDYRYDLRRVARQIGIEGGVILHQVTPWIPWYDRPEEKRKGFAHLFTMIGVVDSSGVETLDEAIEAECSGEDYNTIRLPADTRPTPCVTCCSGRLTSSTVSDLDIVVSDRKALRFGIPGCGGLAAVVSCSTSSRHGPMRRRCREPGFTTPLATGVNRRPTRNRCSRKRRAKSEYGEENRKWAFESENARKHRDAEARRRQLAVIALPFYPEIQRCRRQASRKSSPTQDVERSRSQHKRSGCPMAGEEPAFDGYAYRVREKSLVREKDAGQSSPCQERLEQACAQTAE